MTAPVDGARLHNQGHYVEDQVMLLDVILLTSLITRLNIIPSVVSYVDIKRVVRMGFAASINFIDKQYLDGVLITVGILLANMCGVM